MFMLIQPKNIEQFLNLNIGKTGSYVFKSLSMKKSTDNISVVFVRHGESEWNKERKFCGWVDIGLSKKGEKTAYEAGELILQNNLKFDIGFTSVLKRAQKSLDLILKASRQSSIPIVKSWTLNERHYGDLTGKSKEAMVEQYGLITIKKWRRAYDARPPAIEKTNPYYNEILNDKAYKDGPPKENFPMSESLKDVSKRVLLFWHSDVAPAIKKGKRIIIVAHGSTCRALIKFLDKVSDKAIAELNVPNAFPFVYYFDNNVNIIPGGQRKFLNDPKDVAAEMQKVKDEIIKKK